MSVNSNIIFRSSIINEIAVLLLFIIIAFLLPRLITSYGLVTIAGGAILIPLMVVFFMRPKIGLLGFIATDFLFGKPAFAVSSSLSTEFFTVSAVRFMGFIVLVSWIVRTLVRNEKLKFVKAPQNVILLLYFLATMASALFSKYPFNGLLDIQTLGMQIALYFFVMSMIDSPKMIERIVWTMVLLGIASTVVGMYQIIFLSVRRLAGTRVNPNLFASTNVTFLSLMLSQLFNSKSKYSRVLLGIIAAFLVFSIILSGSRAGLITLGFITVLLLIRSARRPKDVLKSFFVLSAIAAIFVVLLNSFGINASTKLRILRIPSPLSFVMNPMSVEEQSARNRALQIQVAKEMFLARPILGHGPRTYIMLGHLYYPTKYRSGMEFDRSPHNIYIALLTEHGILGTFLFLCLIGFTLRDFRKAGLYFRKQRDSTLLNWTRGIELSYIGLLFFGLSSATGLSDKYMFIAMALAPVLKKLATQKRIYEAKVRQK